MLIGTGWFKLLLIFQKCAMINPMSTDWDKCVLIDLNGYTIVKRDTYWSKHFLISFFLMSKYVMISPVDYRLV